VGQPVERVAPPGSAQGGGAQQKPQKPSARSDQHVDGGSTAGGRTAHGIPQWHNPWDSS